MAKKKKDLSPLWERSEYEVISETETETGLVAVLRVKSSGARVSCHIPRLAPDEEQKISEDIAQCLMQMIFTGQDITRFASIEILTD